MSHCIVYRRVLIIYKQKLQKGYKKLIDFCSQEYMFKSVSVRYDSEERVIVLCIEIQYLSLSVLLQSSDEVKSFWEQDLK